MKQLLKDSQEGYSLVELIIVLGLVGLVLALGFTVFGLGQRMYTRGTDRAMLQQEERYLSQFLPQELRFAYDVELYTSVDEVQALAEGETILYSDARGVWQKHFASDATLILPTDQVTYDIAFRRDGETGLLVVGYRVGPVSRDLPTDYNKVPVHLFNSALSDHGLGDSWVRVVKYSREP